MGLEAAGASDSVSIPKPQSQNFLQCSQNGLLLATVRRIIRHHLVGVVSVASLDHLVGPNEVHTAWGCMMMLDQGMVGHECLDLLPSLGLRGIQNFFPIMDAAFDENCENRSPNNPVVMSREAIEPDSIAMTGRKECDPLKLTDLIA